MKHELEELSGGSRTADPLKKCRRNSRRFFWNAYWTSRGRSTIPISIGLVPPDELDDAGLQGKLKEVLHALAAMRCFLHDTDHLNESRALYMAVD